MLSELELTTSLYGEDGGMSSQALFNWTLRNGAMKSKYSRTSTYFRNRDKPDFNKSKVYFADNLTTVHEVDNYSIYKKANFRFKLPEIDVHKYRPFVCRDPNAKPSARKKYTDMFVSDTVKLPLIKLKTTKNDAKKATPKNRELTEPSEPQFPKASRKASDKFQVGKTLHFRYSDFMLRKMDGSASSKDKIFFVK